MANISLPNPIQSIDQSTNQVQPVQIQAHKATGFWSFIRQARTTNLQIWHTHPMYWGKDAYILEQIRERACQ